MSPRLCGQHTQPQSDTQKANTNTTLPYMLEYERCGFKNPQTQAELDYPMDRRERCLFSPGLQRKQQPLPQYVK